MSDADLENEALVRAYHITFGSPDGQIVLADLAPFCRAAETCFDPDPHVHAKLEGRREVWLRISNFSRLTNEQVMQMIAQRNEAMMQMLARQRARQVEIVDD